MALGPQSRQKPRPAASVFVYLLVPRVMFLTWHGKPWLKPIILTIKNTICHIYGSIQGVWYRGSQNSDYKITALWNQGNISKIFINYLNSDRTQFVAVNDVCSSSKVIQMGVPQGSILDPLLFLIYMNDIPNFSRHLDCILYAHDTTLFNTIGFSAPDEDSDPFKTINGELHKVHVSNWLVANRLSLNIKKTKYMIFPTYKKTPIT